MTPPEEAELRKKVAALEAEVKRLEAPTAQNYAENTRVRFQENGEWARHYSTVRLSITTFLTSVSLGILSLQWTSSALPPLHFQALAGIVWIASILLFLLFTRLTYSAMYSARAKIPSLLSKGDEETENNVDPRTDGAAWVVCVITLIYGALLSYLAWKSVAKPTDAFPSSALHGIAIGTAISVIVIGAVAALWTALQPGFTKDKKNHPRSFPTWILYLLALAIAIALGFLIGRASCPSSATTGPVTQAAPLQVVVSRTSFDRRLLQSFERTLSLASDAPEPTIPGTIVAVAQIDHSTTLYPGDRVQLVRPMGDYYYEVRYQGATYDLPKWQVSTR